MSTRRRPILLIAMAAVGLLCLAAQAQAAASEPTVPAVGPLMRFGRGLVDIVVSPFEVPATMRRVAFEKDAFTGLWAGGAEGVGNCLSRLVAGCVEVVSSPIPGNTLPLYTKRLGECAAPPTGLPTDITRP